MTSRRVAKLGLGLLSLIGLLGLGGSYVRAANFAYNDGSYGGCTYNVCNITLTTSGSISINIAPTGTGLCTIQKDAVGVLTDSTTGYTLTVSDSDTSSNLAGAAHGSNITPGSGSLASPAALTVNKWGYRVDGLGTFGSGPTTAVSNVAISSATFAAVPTSLQTADTIASSSVPADPTVTTDVWYGACANTSIPADTYSDSVTYTAVIN